MIYECKEFYKDSRRLTFAILIKNNCPRSSVDRALASGARCGGSIPLEGSIILLFK